MIGDGIVELINERRRQLGFDELVRDPALDDLATANSSINSANKARAGTYTKNHPESDCGTFIQVFRHPQVRRYGSRSLRPTEYYKTASIAIESIASQSILSSEDPADAMEVDANDKYIGIGITEALDEHGWIEFHGTVYTIDCWYEYSDLPAPPSLVRIASVNDANATWLARNYPTLDRDIYALPWVQDGVTDIEVSAIDEMLYMAIEDVANLRTALELSWVQDDISPGEYEALDRLGWLDVPNPTSLSAALNQSWVRDGMSDTERDIIAELSYLEHDDPDLIIQLLSMPFLRSPDSTDLLAVQGMGKMADDGHFEVLTEHPVFQDGITDDETTLFAAVGALEDSDEIRRVLEPGVATIETIDVGTTMTPHLKISIIRTDSQSRPGTVESVRDAVEFVETAVGLSLPVDHVIIILNEKAVTREYAGTNFGFAFSYLPEYEAAHGTQEWRHLQTGFVHETAHYFWTGNEDWIDEGLANIVEYQFGLQMGLSHGQLQPDRDGCEAHDLEMLSGWNPHRSEYDRFGCNYYLGQLLFQDLLESVGAAAFTEMLREYYPLSLEAREADRTPGIAEIRQVFTEQDNIIDYHWSGKANARESRGFDEGYEYTSHDLIKWTQYPTYDNGVVSFEGVYLNGSEPSFRLPRPPGVSTYSNFTLRTADNGQQVGSILVPLSGNRRWTLDDPGDVVADTYQIDNATQAFTVAFDFPEGLTGDPSEYVVKALGFQTSDRMPTIGESIDTLGYARIRVEADHE